jgi:hypothetical protein
MADATIRPQSGMFADNGSEQFVAVQTPLHERDNAAASGKLDSAGSSCMAVFDSFNRNSIK